MKVFINILGRIIGIAGAIVITYVNSKYFLMGVTVERGYEAIGGEFILIGIIFVALYSTFSRVAIAGLSDLLESVFEVYTD